MSRRTRTPLVVATALVALLTVAGCSSSGSDAKSSDSAASSADRGATDSLSVQDTGLRDQPEAAAQRRLVISTGTVSLSSRDVSGARADVRRVVDRYRGEVAEQQSETDSRGRLRYARLVLRIPSADFAEAVATLERTADFVASDTSDEDVTVQVIDTRVALRVQRRSVARVTILLDRATSIRDVIAIEGQLSRRQARLGALEQQAAYLADQTAMSTLTVSIERRGPRAAPADHDGGFLAGLGAGWHGLGAVAVVLATTLGALLPFAVVLLVLLVPGWPLLRRLRRRRATTATATATA